MILIREVNSLSLKLLERIYRQSRHHQVRQRAHCLILVSQGAKIEELSRIFQVSYKTLYNWMSRWESEGVLGLYNKPGRGTPSKLNETQKQKIREWAKQQPRQLKQVVQKVKEEWGITVSSKTIKRIIKMLSMSWHRMRRDVGGEPDPIEYKEKSAQLTQLKQLEDEGKINLYYLDETGFCLILSVPYGWQEIGEYLTIPSRRSPRLNVLGIMNRNNHLEAYVSFQSINSDVIITCIDTFFPQVDKPTVIVVDQSSIHTSNTILDKIEEWKESGITIFELPTYSPQLNLIEILWRFIKYEWLEIDAYKDWKTFVASVEKILREFGKEYVINFV
ncbi:IS630 family transposase [Nostoc sp. FACHB-152]|uniref:IS630 family transposase n=1 Tax=unclassified Nostoc TaxID=2593658 RepID=UPI001688B07C|nr:MULTISPECIES: IS630 family transposase [unclassified Nostoc]MBD2449293.1 IS630 family transposase [Nostoc sp. FACHB-152]MBD2470429.1 IS630 family transposase [Nostoc sp. FACHB-145]